MKNKKRTNKYIIMNSNIRFFPQSRLEKQKFDIKNLIKNSKSKNK